MDDAQAEADTQASTSNEKDSSRNDLSQVKDVSHPCLREAIMKRRKYLRQKAKTKAKSAIADLKFHTRSTSNRVKHILQKHPDIGQQMDRTAKEAGLGVDRWQRTGVTVLEHGGEKVEKKMSFRRMQKLLQDHFNDKNISYGTVVQLSIAKNKRNKSAKRYAGVASITSRKCQKGFQLRLHPDKHWSNAMYSALDVLQLKDGKGLELTNRDDASAFRLDTMCMQNQYKTLVS